MPEKFTHHSEPSQPELKMKAILNSLGLEYHYQLPVRSGFVLDFAFPDRMKAIEVDGFFHQFTRAKDAFRDYILHRGGWDILRIPAEDLDDDSLKSAILTFLSR